MASEPPPDPLLVEIVESALAPYLALASPAILAVMRAEMMDALANNPYPAGLLRKLRSAAVVYKSGPRPIEANGAGREDAPPEQAASSGRRGGR